MFFKICLTDCLPTYLSVCKKKLFVIFLIFSKSCFDENLLRFYGASYFMLLKGCHKSFRIQSRKPEKSSEKNDKKFFRSFLSEFFQFSKYRWRFFSTKNWKRMKKTFFDEEGFWSFANQKIEYFWSCLSQVLVTVWWKSWCSTKNFGIENNVKYLLTPNTVIELRSLGLIQNVCHLIQTKFVK